MTTIIAGIFDQISRAEETVEAILPLGFARAEVAIFIINPPGQHDMCAPGGAEDENPGTTGAPSAGVIGALIGGATLAGAGIVVAAATGGIAPLAILGAGAVGAYTGSFMGALSGLNGPGDKMRQAEGRLEGVMVAINVGQKDKEDAISILRGYGARDIEEAEGVWRDGDWVDLNPAEPPHLIEAKETP